MISEIIHQRRPGIPWREVFDIAGCIEGALIISQRQFACRQSMPTPKVASNCARLCNEWDLHNAH
jgi:hypothetical protein